MHFQIYFILPSQSSLVLNDYQPMHTYCPNNKHVITLDMNTEVTATTDKTPMTDLKPDK